MLKFKASEEVKPLKIQPQKISIKFSNFKLAQSLSHVNLQHVPLSGHQQFLPQLHRRHDDGDQKLLKLLQNSRVQVTVTE